MGSQHFGEGDFPAFEVLPEIVIEAPPDPSGVRYGEADFPEVQQLPELVIPAGESFILRVEAAKPGDAIPAEVESLLRSLRDCDAALGGSGLVFDLVPGGKGAVAYCVTAIEQDGAAERLRAIRDVVNGTNGAAVPAELVERVRLASRGFRCEALPA